MMEDIRWKQRYDNFDRAFVLLRDVHERGFDTLSQLEKEGAIQRFEFALELAWKTLKDYMEEQGIIIKPVTPRNVIKSAFAAKLLDDAQVWLDMIQHRNLLSHRYDRKTFDVALLAIKERYFTAFEGLHDFFLTQMVKEA